MSLAKAGTAARYALGGIRIVNGALGLVVPQFIIRRFGDEKPDANPAAIYGLRLFGIRTILLGLDLVRRPVSERAVNEAVLIHASDTATVVMLQQRGQLPPDRAKPLLLISGLNTVLAVTAAVVARRTRT